MANRRLKPEEIVSKLRQVEVLMGQGMSRLDAIRQLAVVDVPTLAHSAQYKILGQWAKQRFGSKTKDFGPKVSQI